MKTQYDGKSRVVAVENLRAMCEHVSGTCHRYWIETVSRSRVTIGSSNPDEYARERHMFAVFPCVPNPFDKDGDNPFVLLTGPGSLLRVVNDDRDGEGWQCFQILRDCPVMFRRTDENRDTWRAHEEESIIDAVQALELALGDALPQAHDYHVRVTMLARVVAESDGGKVKVSARDNREAIALAIRENRANIQPKY